MSESIKTIGQLLYDGIDENEYLNEIYDSILFNYTAGLFKLDVARKDIDLAHALRFSDILSKSVDVERGDKHRIWAQEIVALLMAITAPNSEGSGMIQQYLGSVLYSSGNYQGLSIKAKNYQSIDPLDRLYNGYKREYFHVPASPDKYFMQSQKAVYDHFNDEYFSYSGPTSMGKSFVMQMFIKEQVQSGKKGNFCILVPSKALINEVTHDISEELQGLMKKEDYRIVTSAGAYILQEEADLHNFIFIMTPERLMYLLIAFESMPIEYVFVDEAQKISLPDGRSAFYYKVVSMLGHREHRPHFVFASPNIPNPEVYLQLVPNAVKSEDRVLASSYAPVSQAKILVDCVLREVKYYNDHSKKLTFVSRLSTAMSLKEIIRECGGDSKSIIYCKSKDEVVSYALDYAKDMPSLNNPELDALADDIRNEVHGAFFLAETISKGVAYHMGYLPTTIRLRIEEQFRKPGGLRTLFCTSTLLEGVNLPADNLFVTHYNKGGKPMEAIDFKNLIGRVGRIQYNLYGNVYLVCLDQTVNQTEYFNLLQKDVEPQVLSIRSLAAEYKEYVAECLMQGNAKLEKLKGQTKEEYSLMRKIANILLRDIMLGRETRVVREFREYLTVEQMEQIKAQFSDRVSQPDDDINISTDQKERLIKAIEGGLRYPKISYTGFIDYKETLAFLEQLHDVFDWETYEKDTLGSKNRLKKYVVLLEKWIKGESLKQIIDEDVDYRWTKKRMVYLPNSKEVFNGSPAHINQVISDNLNMINDVLLFRLANYFLRFSSEYRSFHNLKSLGFNDWYEFVEYGTWEYFPINLQKNGFSREVASYINRYRGNYTVEIDGRTLLKRSLFRCANASVSREAKEVAYNMPELFEEE